MRSLKFRAWDKVTKRYYTVCGLEYGENGELCEIYLAGIQIDESNPNANVRKPSDVILEQYTGLKDKNGKEIYEGDIVKFRERAYEVKFDKYGQFYIENKNYHWLENGYSFRSVDIWCAEGILVEVVGNIHENGDLLDAKD